MSNAIEGRVFFLDALDLISSYLFDKSVELEITPVGIATLEEELDETGYFLNELEARHALACAMKLKGFFSSIEQRTSNSRQLTRSESRESIKGRIDIPFYIAHRQVVRTLPRVYPLQISEETPQTPENALIVQCLKGLALQLGRSTFPRSKSEGLASLSLYSWIRSRLHRWPWAEVRKLASIALLQRQVEQRVRKRQTGNEFGYEQLLDWLAEWQVDIQRLGETGKSSVAEGILAFPQGEAFWNKVFEIWCLREVANALIRCGYTLQGRPVSLDRRTSEPIYRFYNGSNHIEVWFQRQFPFGQPEWRYVSNNRPLTGIPDIVVSSEAHTPLIVDAKFREVKTETRSEETYKMLGYAENFRGSISSGAFHGIVVLIGAHSSERVLAGPNNARISLLVVESSLSTRSHSEQSIDRAIMDWLSLGTKRL